jgi:uncharacterized phage-associated protein
VLQVRPYQAVDIANYVIKKAIDSKKPVSNLKLQKILYYLQARFLVDTGNPLFNDDIKKWKYGPVVESVYHEFKNNGSSPITNVLSQIYVEYDNEGKISDIQIKQFDENDISAEDRRVIDQTIEVLNDYGAFELVDKTHRQPIWQDYEYAILNFPQSVGPYTNNEIKEFFENHEEEQIWKRNK